MSQSGRIRLEGLQVLRFAAAFMVLFGHLIHEGATFGFLPPGAEAAFSFLPWEAGVDIFFVISGFIMFHVSADDFGRPGAQGAFLRRRIIRLVPLYWLFSLAMLAAILLVPGRINNTALDPAHILASLTFLPWINAEHMVQPVLALGWTLNYEMFFYALFSLALLLPRRYGVLGLAALLLALALGHGAVPDDAVQARFWTNPLILEFAAGMLIAFGFSRGWQVPRRFAPVLALLGLLGLAAAPSVLLDGDFARPLLYGLPAALIVAGVAASGFVAKTRLGRAAVLVGDASYALYLSHPFSVNLVALAAGKLALGAAFVPVTLVFAILVSIGVHLIMERPLTRWLNRRGKARAEKKAGERSRDPTLDMFRGIAILGVALYHFTARLPHEALNMKQAPGLDVGFGWLGVYFFFVISGYCIYLTLTRSDSVTRFLARRVSRLYPAFALAAIGLFVFGLLVPVPSVSSANFHEQPVTLFDLALNLVFFGEAGEWVNGSFWSIAAEMRFYVLLALLALVLGTGEKLARVFAVFAAGMATLWVGIEIALPWQAGATPGNVLRAFGLAPYLPFFAFGILLFMRRNKAMATNLLLALNGVVMALVLAMDSYGSSYLHPTGLVDALVVIATFAALMTLFLRFADGKPMPNVPVIGPFLAYAGFHSYSWYLMHETLGLTLMSLIGPYLPPAMTVAVALAATLAMAALFSWAVEWRFRKPVEEFAFRVLTFLGNLAPHASRRRPAE